MYCPSRRLWCGSSENSLGNTLCPCRILRSVLQFYSFTAAVIVVRPVLTNEVGTHWRQVKGIKSYLREQGVKVKQNICGCHSVDVHCGCHFVDVTLSKLLCWFHFVDVTLEISLCWCCFVDVSLLMFYCWRQYLDVTLLTIRYVNEQHS